MLKVNEYFDGQVTSVGFESAGDQIGRASCRERVFRAV